jgi:hypothetical protein
MPLQAPLSKLFRDNKSYFKLSLHMLFTHEVLMFYKVNLSVNKNPIQPLELEKDQKTRDFLFLLSPSLLERNTIEQPDG